MRRRRVIGTGLAGGLALLLVACAPASPVSEYTAANGSRVEVRWRDYPGHAGMAADQVLQAPVAEKVDERARNVMRAIERRLSAEFGLEWEDGPVEGGLYPQEGNGYGGDSLYVTYNSGTRESLGVPDFSEWQRVLDVVDGAAPAYGFEAVNLDAVMVAGEEFGVGPERARDEGVWEWGGTARAAGQWLNVSITDVRRDTSGKAESRAGGAGNGQAIALSYGATTLHQRDREVFLERLQPFLGLERPPATTSD